MANNLMVITSNELKTKDGGFHEIHEIKFLSSPEHALETVKNIIDCNIQFTESNCPLVSVDIQCEDWQTYRCIKEFYNKYSDDIDIYVTYNS